MSQDSNVYILIGDVGYGILDELRNDFGDRAINFGSSEQLLLGSAVGMALEGKIPVCYTITPFLILRPFEFIRNYLNAEKIAVKLVGSGRNRDYAEAGLTHHATDIPEILGTLPNVKQYFPQTNAELGSVFQQFVYSEDPAFLSLRR